VICRYYPVIFGAAFCLLIQGCATQAPQSATISRQIHWTFNAPRGNGYSIDLVSVQPTPGTPLTAGAAVTFMVKVKYSMTVSKRGVVALVFQKGREAVPGTSPQQRLVVEGSAGVVELTQIVTIPTQTSRLQLSVPLFPEGMAIADGEIVIRYPVVDK
jgi:hypothetical protein